MAETREKKADVRELAGEQGRDGIRTQPSWSLESWREVWHLQ